MKLDHTAVAHLSQLAKLALSEAEQEKIQQELTAILAIVETLNTAPTEGVPPTSQVTGLENVMREDQVNYNFEREDMIATMPDTDADGALRVHAVFTGDSPSH